MPPMASTAAVMMKGLWNQSLALPSSSIAVSDPRPTAMNTTPPQSTSRSSRKFIGSLSRPMLTPSISSTPGTQLM